MEPPSSPRVSVSNQSPVKGLSTPVRHAVATTLQAYGLEGEVSVLLTDDSGIRELNRRFRGIDEPTDVLTFPAPEDVPGLIGDLAISIPFASRQADERGISLRDEVSYLAIHGALHLAGFDDEEEADRAAMQREMARCGKALGLAPQPEWTSLLHGAAS